MDELENTQGALASGQPAEVVGAFHESLVRTNRQIKADRAAAISEDVETVYTEGGAMITLHSPSEFVNHISTRLGIQFNKVYYSESPDSKNMMQLP